MTTITQTITTLPTAPDPATMTPTEFSAAAAAYVLAQKDMVPQLNTWAGQVNTVAGEVNANANAASASAVTATNASAAVVAAANFGGNWDDLTGAAMIPLSVFHADKVWLLTENAADITAVEPGVSSIWASLGGGSKIIRVPRTSNTILTSANNSNLIDVTSGTFSQTLDPAATIGADWFVYYRNSGTGVVTIDPDGAETIDGAATYIIGPGESAIIQCNGTAFFTATKYVRAGLNLLASYTLSATATIDIEDFSSTYDEYIIEGTDIYFANRTFGLNLRFKLAGSYITTSTYSQGNHLHHSTATDVVYTRFLASQSSIQVWTVYTGSSLNSEAGNALTFPQGFTIKMRARNSTRKATVEIESRAAQISGSNIPDIANGVCVNSGNGPIEGIRLYTGGSSIDSGTIRVYGVKK